MIFETTSVNFRPSVLTMIVEHSRYSGSRKVRISRISVMPPVAVRFGRRDTVEASCRMRDPIVCTDAISQTTGPASRRSRLESAFRIAPPPVERTSRSRVTRSATTSRSNCRNAASPSFAKISLMVLPARRSTSLSVSSQSHFSRRASRIPTVLLPVPRYPIRESILAIEILG